MRRFITIALSVFAFALSPVQPSRATVTPLPPDATLVVPGHGWGHGRGMGQWGAKGMALDGKPYTSILMHYYSNVAIGARTAESIRVLVESSPYVLVTAGAPFKVSWSNGTVVATSDDTFRYWRVKYDGSVYRVEKSTSPGGPWQLVATSSMWARFTRTSSLLQIIFDNGVVRYYRGSIIARYYSTDGMRAINELALQEYLYGSVPRESPASWPAESLKAQAVAARTYAVYKKDAARARGRMYDICASTQCQVYLGFASKPSLSGTRTDLEHDSTNAAVDATAGNLLLYEGKPILAEYSSSTGGYSAPGSVAYQQPVPDAADAVSPHHEWVARIRVSDVEREWPQIGRLVHVRETSRNGFGEWGGRVKTLELMGTSSTIAISGSAWRSAFEWPARASGVRSTWFDVRYWRGELVSAPGALTLLEGESATIVAHIKNTGNTSWMVGGPVRLATTAASPLATEAWISPTRPAAVAANVTTPSKSTVSPGETAEFRVPLRASGVAPGLYALTFSAIADGFSTMATRFVVPVQVLPAWTEEAPNLLTNGSFESGIFAWPGTGLVSGDGISTSDARDGTRSLRLTGGTKSVAQAISLAGGTARRFTIGGWNRASGTTAGGGPIELRATVSYADGTSEARALRFSTESHPWTYDEVPMLTSAAKQLASITFGARIANQTGEASFDALRLLESPVANHSFEDGMTAWGQNGTTTGDGTTTAAARDGARSLVLAGSGTKSVTQVIPLSARRTERFIFSAWSKTAGTDPSGGQISVTLVLKHPDGTTTAVPLEFSRDEHDWSRQEVVVTAPKDVTSASLSVARANQTGSAYFDAIRIARTFTTNSSFESALTNWIPYGFAEGDGISTIAREGAAGLRLAGPGRQRVVQRVGLSSGAGKRLVISGWTRASGTSASKGPVGLVVIFRNSDGTSSSVIVPVARAPHRWAYVERAVVAPKRFGRVDVYARLYDQTGSAFFDAIALRLA